MQIDCYGFEASSQWFKRRTLDPYLIKRSEGITYLCFGNQLNRPIHRIDRDENGSVRQSWAFERWLMWDCSTLLDIDETPDHNC